MNRMLIAGLLALSATPVLAAAGLDQTHALSKNAALDIQNVAGSVKVVGWDKPSVHVTGSLGSDDQKLKIAGDASHLTVKVAYPHHDENSEGATLVVEVPRTAHLNVGTVSASIDTSGVSGPTHLQSVSGKIDADGKASSLAAESVSGDIAIKADRHAPDSVKLSNTSGDIGYEGLLAKTGRYDFQAVSGKIDLMLPPKADAKYSLRTLSGDIHNAFGPKPSQGDYSPATRLEFATGSGKTKIDAQSVSGDIALDANH